MSDHWLDALEYAMRPKKPRHLRGWRKAWSWLRSRPLARARRTLATEKRIRAKLREGVRWPPGEVAAHRWDEAHNRWTVNRDILVDNEAFRRAWERLK